MHLLTIRISERKSGEILVSLRDTSKGGKRYAAYGGGYDMIGTVFGEWLERVYGQRILKNGLQEKDFSGLYVAPGQIKLDGAFGMASMIKIAKAIGLEVRELWNGRGSRMDHILVFEKRGE